MKVTLAVLSGPHQGKEYSFEGRDSFLVGRSKHSHFQLSQDDPYFSRRHFLIEVQPPRCRLLDLKSHNGVYVNGERVAEAELTDGDQIKAGHTVMEVRIELPDPDEIHTIHLPNPDVSTIQHIEATQSIPVASHGNLLGYRIKHKIGQGTMGEVYRAERLTDKKPVAIKQLKHADAAPSKAVEMFFREARILGQLKHPNIVEFIDAVEDENSPYLVMEFVEGVDSLKLVQSKGPLAVPVAVRLVIQIANGLQYAHEAGFVHRDIKPSNILIGGPKSARVVKVADFGLARAYETSKMSGLTMYNEIGGTPAFMPPEQITHYRDVKPTADQYSLAATLYYMLTGKYVYDFSEKGDAGSRLVTIMTEEPIPILERRPDLPAKLAEAISRALKREPAKRYRSVSEFSRAIRPFAKSQ